MERAQRSSSEQITITIRSDNQKVPVDLDMFWSSMLNKVRLQEYVFKWMLQNVVSEKEIIFGGVNGGECRKLLAGIESEITELSSNQEEADDRIMFHINDGVVKHGVQSVLVDSPDTDVFVNLIFHFHKTWQLQKLFVKLGKRKNKKTVPVYLLVDQLDNNLVSCLPAIHALSGCDSTSKVGPKLSGMKASMDLSLLEGFGVEELSPQMISNAEKFLVSGLKNTDCSTFDEYRWEQYHNAKKELDFNQLVCCSSTLGEHIKRAYLQCKMLRYLPKTDFNTVLTSISQYFITCSAFYTLSILWNLIMWIFTFFAFSTATKHNTFYVHSSTSARGPTVYFHKWMYQSTEKWFLPLQILMGIVLS